MNDIPPRLIRQVFIILLILFMGSLIFREMLPYLTGVLGAITIYILFRKWMSYLVKKKKWNASLAATLIMIISFVCILLPLAGIVWMLSNKIGRAVKNSEQVVNSFKEQLSNLEHYVGFDIASNK